jgi:solute carrier family 25 carnitine/acylcarnitine transporter 20/29
MDSVMLGSLTLYRRLLNEHVFQPMRAQPDHPAVGLSDT